jgi:phage tail-like protein
VDDPADRLFDLLPAIFRQRDSTDELKRLLHALGTYFLSAHSENTAQAGLEQYVERIPALFAPLGEPQESPPDDRTPDRFLHWLATWLSFSPHALFSAERLRHITAGIVQLYGLRGTKAYLQRLLDLCFGDELGLVSVDDRPRVGFTVGQSTVGNDTRLSVGRPFTFKVVVEPRIGRSSREDLDALRQRLRAVIDFAKPAHTVYDLEWRISPHGHSRHQSTA